MMLGRCAQVLVTSGGIGFLPAPGTMGSLFGLALYGLMNWRIPDFIGSAGWYLVLLVSFMLSWGAVAVYLDYSKRVDPPEVIIDEIMGILIAVTLYKLFMPELSVDNGQSLIYLFLLFRLFDISKLFPVCVAERHPWPAFAVMLDDIVAGCMAVIVLKSIQLAGVWG